MDRRIDQSRSRVSGDQVAGDKIEGDVVAKKFVYYGPQTAIDKLLEKLAAEVEKNLRIRTTIDRLQRFQRSRSTDGIDGLEAKLKHAARDYEIPDAFEKKEQFAMLLERFGYYASAQDIFAYLLARVEYEFNQFVYPDLDQMTTRQVNQIVDERIISPTVQECGGSVIPMDHAIAMGMVYWLAEQCYVRWHR